jgi:hypothetical protein
VDHAISLIIFAILTLAGLVLKFIGFVDRLLAGLMTAAHVPPNAQLVLLVAVAVILGVMALRALGGIFATLIIVLLVLLLAHQSFPQFQLPQAHLPGVLEHIPGQFNTTL